MKKKCKKVSSNKLAVSVISLIVTVSILAVATWVYADVSGAVNQFTGPVTLNQTNNVTNAGVPTDMSTPVDKGINDFSAIVGSDILGSNPLATSTSYYSRLTKVALGNENLGVGGMFRYDMGISNKNGMEYQYLAGNCTTGTTTQISILAGGTPGTYWRVQEAYLTLTGGTLATTRFSVGTSSIAYSAMAANTQDTSSEGIHSILQTGDIAAATATSTNYWLADYRGVDTRDGSGAWYNVIVQPGQYIIGVATSSSSSETGVTSTASMWNCKYGFLLKRSDNAN